MASPQARTDYDNPTYKGCFPELRLPASPETGSEFLWTCGPSLLFCGVQWLARASSYCLAWLFPIRLAVIGAGAWFTMQPLSADMRFSDVLSGWSSFC